MHEQGEEAESKGIGCFGMRSTYSVLALEQVLNPGALGAAARQSAAKDGALTGPKRGAQPH